MSTTATATDSLIGDPLDREKIEQEYSWAFEEGQKMVTGTDLDALLTAAYLHHKLDWELVGFYDLENVYYKEGERENLTDAVWVDLDIYDERIQSIGHHILSFRPHDWIYGHNNTLNPNLERGIYGEGYRFTRKCPVGTIQFMYWLHEPDVNLYGQSRYLTWLADSAWINGQSHKYRENVETWVRNVMRVPAIAGMFAEIDHEQFEQVMEKTIMQLTRDTGFSGISGQSKSRHLDIGGGQCGFSDPRDVRDDVETVFERIQQMMQFEGESVTVPEEMGVIEGDRTSRLDYDYGVLKEYQGIDEWLADEEPFSYAIPYSGTLNYTSNIEL